MLEDEVARIYDLCHHGMNLRALARETGLPADRIAGILADLEVVAWVLRLDDGWLSLAMRPHDVLVQNLLARTPRPPSRPRRRRKTSRRPADPRLREPLRDMIEPSVRRALSLLAILLALAAAGCDRPEPPASAGPPAPAAAAPVDLYADFAGTIPDEVLKLFLVSFRSPAGAPYAEEFAAKLARLPGFAFEPGEIDAMLLANDERAAEEPGYNNVTIVVRTRTERSIEDAFHVRIEHTRSALSGLDAATVRGGFFPSVQIVRLDARTFLYYRGARRLEDLVERWRTRRAPKLAAEAIAFLEGSRGFDACLAVLPGNRSDEHSLEAVQDRSGIRATFDRVRFGEPIEYEGLHLYADEAEATDRLARMSEGAGETDDPAAAEAVRALETRRDGRAIHLSARFTWAGFRALLVGEGLPVISQPGF